MLCYSEKRYCIQNELNNPSSPDFVRAELPLFLGVINRFMLLWFYMLDMLGVEPQRVGNHKYKSRNSNMCFVQLLVNT